MDKGDKSNNIPLVMEIRDSKLDGDSFMKIFKYYKSNKPKPCRDEVITVDKFREDKVFENIPNTISDDSRTQILGLRSLKEWQTFTFKKYPGLIFIRNPFTILGQKYWIRRCLEVYPRKPSKLNIDIEININDWWSECHKNDHYDKQLAKKLRWTTFGYHHNWDTKVYQEDNQCPFPEDLAELTDVTAKYLGYNNFKAQAAIVNYYHMNSTLSAHTDHSEVNLEAPLFSFSFGQSAIFLIGGKEKSIEPSAILINSGDIVVMSKEARLCYHAVPKILPSSKQWDSGENTYLTSKIDTSTFKYITKPKEVLFHMKESLNDEKWLQYKDYVQESRINMNVRQVLNENQTSL